MELTDFAYEVKAVLKATSEELGNMTKCSRSHYDWKCQDASAVAGQSSSNGFLTIWRMFHPDPYTLSRHQLDILCKIMESPSANQDLYYKLRQILRDVDDRVGELYGEAKQDRGPILHPILFGRDR